MKANNILKTPFDFYRHVDYIKNAILYVVNSYCEIGESFDIGEIEMPITPQMNGDWHVKIIKDSNTLISIMIDVEQVNILLTSHKDSLGSIFNLWYTNKLQQDAIHSDIMKIQDAIRTLDQFKITPLEYNAILEIKQYDKQRFKIANTISEKRKLK